MFSYYKSIISLVNRYSDINYNTQILTPKARFFPLDLKLSNKIGKPWTRRNRRTDTQRVNHVTVNCEKIKPKMNISTVYHLRFQFILDYGNETSNCAAL